jgi:hypothetical protein
MKAFSKILLLLIITIFAYKALLGICFWYREKTENLGLPGNVLDSASDDILMGGVILITVLLSAQIGKRRCK